MKAQRKLMLINLKETQARAALKFLVCRMELKDGRPKITESYVMAEGFADMIYCHCNNMKEYRQWLNFNPWDMVQAERKRLTGHQAPKPHTCGKMYVWTYEAYELMKNLYLNSKSKIK